MLLLLWTPTHGCTSVGPPGRTYTHQLCADTECSLEEQTKVMAARNAWRDRVKGTCAISITWWLWWWLWLNSGILDLYENSLFIKNNFGVYLFIDDTIDRSECHTGKKRILLFHIFLQQFGSLGPNLFAPPPTRIKISFTVTSRN